MEHDRPSPASAGGEACQRVSLEAEVPEVLLDGMREFLQGHPDWDPYRLMTSALAGFLFQNGCRDRAVAELHLDALMLRPPAQESP